MYLKKPCPICKNKMIKKCPAIKWRVNLIVAVLFRPAWLITLIVTFADYRYKCDACGKTFGKHIFN